ncbi:hypothetical protein F5Y10DRAFT_260052 [Nemania abortiva]|nr:hypothetical protein F5Y10DRAFT_260052 [Nemania abortiva]
MGERPNISTDKSQLIQLLVWFLFIVSAFGICARVGTNYVSSGRTLRQDDKIILVAQVVFLAQTVSVSLCASLGLGKAIDTLSDQRVSNILKTEYAITPLTILTLTLVKWSLASFLYQLSLDRTRHRITAGNAIIVGLWMVTSMVASLSRCTAPAPWDFIHGQHCIDRGAWWTYVSVMNIATELCFIVQYFLVFRSIPLSRTRRAILIFIFSTRILVVAAIVAQVVAFRDTYLLPDVTFNAWLPTTLNQVVGSLSITTACVPYLKSFLQSLEADVIRVNSVGDAGEVTPRDCNDSCVTGYSLTVYRQSIAV